MSRRITLTDEQLINDLEAQAEREDRPFDRVVGRALRHYLTTTHLDDADPLGRTAWPPPSELKSLS